MSFPRTRSNRTLSKQATLGAGRVAVCTLGIATLFAGCIHAGAQWYEPNRAAATPGAGGAPIEAPSGHEGDDEVAPSETPVVSAPPSRFQLWAAWNALRGDGYELDVAERFLEAGERLECAADTLVRYPGTTLRYQGGSVLVHAAFRERLIRFEALVDEVAQEVYGRSPRRVLHFGAYNCRSSRNRSSRKSEHALGNAIDVSGFEFGPATKATPLPEGLPRSLRGAFDVRIVRHWSASAKAGPAGALHARFLETLSTRLSERGDVFRVMIGPSRPNHHDHFHFDMSPWRYVRF